MLKLGGCSVPATLTPFRTVVCSLLYSDSFCLICAKLDDYYLRTRLYSYTFLQRFSLTTGIHPKAYVGFIFIVTTRTAIDTSIPQVIIIVSYRYLCTTTFGLCSRSEDTLSKNAAFVPNSNHLVRRASVLLVCDHRHQHPALLSTQIHPTHVVVDDLWVTAYSLLGSTKQPHWCCCTTWLKTGLRYFCVKSTSYVTLPWHWSATAGFRVPHARILTHGQHPITEVHSKHRHF